MTGPVKESPGYLLTAGRSVQIDEAWAAVGLPSNWGRIVLDALGEQAGAVFEYRAMSRLVWVLPPGGAADWPLARNNAVYRFGPGGWLPVPGLAVHRDTRWLAPHELRRIDQETWWRRSPREFGLIDPALLRRAVETVLGPLEVAGALPPVHVCRVCSTPGRDGRVVTVLPMPGGLDCVWWACHTCLEQTATGRPVRRAQ